MEPVDILVVDDRDDSHAAFAAIVAGPDVRLLRAKTGAEALRILLQQDVALLVLDIVLPDTSGFDVAELVRARERTRDLPIIFITAHPVDRELAERAVVRARAIDCFGKPLIPELVRARVQMVVEQYRARARLAELSDTETARALVQLELSSERRYRSLAETLPNIVWTAAPDGTVDYFNRRWFEYTGISVERAARSFLAAVHPDDVARTEAAWRAALDAEQPLELECRLRRPDGTDRWQLCRAVPERGASGQVVAWLGSFTDVDDAHRAAAVHAELTGTIDAVLDAVLIIDAAELRFQYVNQGALAMLGYSHAELMALRPPDVLAEHDEAGFRDLIAPLLAHDKPLLTSETKFRRRDGTAMAVEVSLQLIAVDGGRIVAIARDITERTRVQLERELLYRETADALRARDEFISIASHELRTPLSALQLQLDMLMHPPRRDPEATVSYDELRQKLAVAERQVDRMSRLIDEFLDVSRITGGRLRLEREETDLAAIVRDVVERLAAHAARARCTVELVAPRALQGTWDRLRLDQVVTNLLTNAFKFGAGKPIEITLEDAGPLARLTVTDHGIGIAPDDIERIFRRFEQAVSTRTYAGLGLGLYIVHGIVEAHGGTIRVESEPNVGSTFTVELPRQPEVAEHADAHVHH